MYADNMNMFAEALEFYNKALALDPNYVDAWNNKGFALRSLGKEEESQSCYKSAEEAKKKLETLKGLKRAQLRLGNDLEEKVSKILEADSDTVMDSPKDMDSTEPPSPKKPSFSSQNMAFSSFAQEPPSPNKPPFSSQNMAFSNFVQDNSGPLIQFSSEPLTKLVDPPAPELRISEFSVSRVLMTKLTPFTENDLISEEEPTKVDFTELTNQMTKVAIQTNHQTIIT